MNTKPTDIVAETVSGRIRGYEMDGVRNFRGIPYGGLTDGERRFRVAGAAAAWDDVRDATRTGPRAVQKFGNLFQTRTGDYYAGGRVGELGLNDQQDSENCLVLNVLAPSSGEPERPVMVYIHGGGFAEGSGVLGVAAQGLVAAEDVVVVSVNHRLNAFGFLYLGDVDERYRDDANAGLQDLVLALEWVRDNIASFGGAPGNVTIFGESGGGGKISAMMAMPAARGLFRRAIVQSGSIADTLTTIEAAAMTDALMDRLGVPGDVNALTRVPARVLHDALGELDFALRPVVDGRVLPWLPLSPEAIALSSDVPMIVGHCEDEMNWLYADDESVFWLDEDEMRSRLRDRLQLDADQADLVVSTYRAVRPVASPSDIYLRATSDATFGRRADLQAEARLRGGERVYKYLFTYDTPVEGGRYAAFHTAELPLVFRLVDYPEMDALSRRISAHWAAFARTGDPGLVDAPWPALDLQTWPTMLFDIDSDVVNDPYRSARELWEHLPLGSLFTVRASRAAAQGLPSAPSY